MIKLKKENPEIEDDDKSFFRLGAAVDCALTSPDRFNKDFLVVQSNRPYGLMGKFVDKLPPGLYREAPLELYEEAYNYAGYRMSIEWVVNKFWGTDEIVQYYNDTVNVEKDVIIISRDEMDKVQKIVELLLANPHTLPYFINEDPDVELLHQVPIYFSYQDVDCKALMDGILINHRDKTITPFDLKTTGMSVYSFPENFVRFAYFRQAAFYMLALLSEESPVAHLKGYDFLPFKFIVAETKPNSYHPAIIYNTSGTDIEVGLKGGSYMGRKVKGVEELMENYRWHVATDLWDMPRELYLNKGELPLNVFDDESK